MAKNIFNMAASTVFNLKKKIIFGRVTITEFQICIYVPNFIEIE